MCTCLQVCVCVCVCAWKSECAGVHELGVWVCWYVLGLYTGVCYPWGCVCCMFVMCVCAYGCVYGFFVHKLCTLLSIFLFWHLSV